MGNFIEFDDNGSSQTRDVNGANEITSSTGVGTPTYDSAGNMTSDGTLKYEYDAWNRLVRVREADNTLVATYEYDGQNHRVTKTLADGTTTNYFYNQQWQVVEERTQSGETTAVNQYVWDVSYVDSPIVQFHDGNNDGDCNPTTDTNDTIRWYTSDANYNVTTMVTIGHSVTDTQHVVYDAYGKAKVYAADWTGVTDPTADGPLYCGYWFDAETANYLARNRYYSTTFSTWISRDTTAADINLYRYCKNKPTIYTDPMGLAEIKNPNEGPTGSPQAPGSTTITISGEYRGLTTWTVQGSVAHSQAYEWELLGSETLCGGSRGASTNLTWSVVVGSFISQPLRITSSAGDTPASIWAEGIIEAKVAGIIPDDGVTYKSDLSTQSVGTYVQAAAHQRMEFSVYRLIVHHSLNGNATVYSWPLITGWPDDGEQSHPACDVLDTKTITARWDEYTTRLLVVPNYLGPCCGDDE